MYRMVTHVFLDPLSLRRSEHSGVSHLAHGNIGRNRHPSRLVPRVLTLGRIRLNFSFRGDQ